MVVLALALASGVTAAAETPAPEIARAVEALRSAGGPFAPRRTGLEAAVVPEFYRRRGNSPAWTEPRTREEMVAAIAAAAEQGLAPGDYRAGSIEKLRGEGARSARQEAELDVLLTAALVRMAWDLRWGRVESDTLGEAGWRRRTLGGDDAVAELSAAVAEGRVRKFLDGLEPPVALYPRLRKALVELRKLEGSGGWPAIADGPKLEAGADDARVPALRERMLLSGDLAEGGSGTRYDEELSAAVRAFQARHGLEADAIIGARTRAAMNVPVAARIRQVRATMERCRQYLHDLPKRYLMVNAAAYRIVLIDDGRTAWRSRVIVGRTETETPMFRAAVESLLLNPTWTVPDSIVRGELLPDLARDPRHLEKERIRVADGRYVQEAGEHNALGRIKFEMPNPHAIYLHDTPSRPLFERTTRTYSHGCVRVEKPLDLAVLLLEDPAWDLAALEAAIGTGKTRRLPLARKVPVFVLYWTVGFDPEGRTEFFPDVYGHDAELLATLDGTPDGARRDPEKPVRPVPAPSASAFRGQASAPPL